MTINTNKATWIDLTISLLYFSGLLILLLPLAAISIQEGDGAEIAFQALKAGVLHPPGFPLYSLISIPLVGLFPDDPYHTLAIFSVVCQSLAAMMLYLTCQLFVKSPLIALAISLCWILFPATFRTATDCEVFCLNNFLVSLFCYLSCRYLILSRGSPFLIALALGLAWSDHHISVFFTPLLLAVGLHNFSLKKSGYLLLGLALGMTPYLYLVFRIYFPTDSLFFPLENFQDLVNYFFRAGYGTLDLKTEADNNDISYIWHFFSLVLQNSTAFILLTIFGLASFNKYRKLNRTLYLAIFACLLSNLWFASKLIFANEIEIHGELLMRFYPNILISLLLCSLLFLRTVKISSWNFLVLILLLLIPAVHNFFNNYQAANARQDQIAEYEIRQILQELPEKAIFLSQLDRTNLGIPLINSTDAINPTVTVMIEGILRLPKYKQLISNRLFRIEEAPYDDLSSFIEIALANNYRVFALLEGALPNQFKKVPYGHTWEILPKDSQVKLFAVYRRQIEYCSNLNAEFFQPIPERINSSIIQSQSFLTGLRPFTKIYANYREGKVSAEIVNAYKLKQYKKAFQLCRLEAAKIKAQADPVVDLIETEK